MLKKEEIKKYFLLGCLLLLIWIIILILKPFANVLLSSFIIAYLFYPIFKVVNKYIKNKTASSILVTALSTSIIILPLSFILNALVKESIALYKSGAFVNLQELIESYLSPFITGAEINKYITDTLNKGINYLVKEATEIIISIPSRILDLAIIIFLTFYLFKEGPKLYEKIKDNLPFKEKIIDQISNEIFAIVYGLLLVAIIETVIASIGFALLNVSSPVLLGFLIGVFAFIPYVGPGAVWVPLSLFYLITKNPWTAIGIFILGGCLSLAEAFLKPKIISDKSNIHPVIVLLGVLGGLKVLGFIGLIAGPLLLSLAFTLLKEYQIVK